MNIINDLKLNLPQMFSVRQKLDIAPPLDPQDSVQLAMATIEDEQFKLKGKRVAVCVGSRGIDAIVTVVRTAVERLRAAGAEVFVLPAMGSHGGATTEGQIDVLAHRGITEESVGCRIIGSMETIHLGETSDGIPLFINQLAHEADALCLINRVKPHTNFIGATGSGILKMAAIGLGNQKGAEHYHMLSMIRDQYQIISSAGREIIKRKENVIGIGLVENQRHQICAIDCASGSGIEEMEKELYLKAQQCLPGLPMDEIDLLIVDEMGKDISGQGIDPNVVGRDCCSYGTRRPSPAITRIFVRDLTPASAGSALGIGQADFCLKRLVDRIDPAATYVNCLTACCPEAARIPMTYQTDLEVLSAALGTIRPHTREDLGIVRIRNTMDLETLSVSEAYLQHLENQPSISILGKSAGLEIGSSGMLRETN